MIPRDYVIVMDLDNVNTQLDSEAVIKTINNAAHWDIATANQRDVYYDLWALRTIPKHNNCWHMGKCDGWSLTQWFPSTPWMKTIPSSINASVNVLSAFGDMGIYKWRYFVVGEYSGVGAHNEQDCEHVAFNYSIRRHYTHVRITIVPYLVNG